jgi:phage FluMu protein Com
MPEEHLRFRCYRCNQLLGASARRIGTVISCPRCKAELKVPGFEEQAAEGPVGPQQAASRARDEGTGSTRGAGNPLPSFIEEIAAAIPDDLATLRPEDIRVEAEFVDLVVTTTEPPATIAPPPSEPAAQPLPVEPVPPVPRPEPARLTPEPPPTVSRAEPIVPPALTPPVDASPGIPLPAIEIEPSTILSRGREFRQAQEVVLQPATVLAWSLLVLMALPMSFIAGLLIGHFVWK